MMPRRGGSTRPRQNPRQQNSQGGKPGMGFQQLPGRPSPMGGKSDMGFQQLPGRPAFGGGGVTGWQSNGYDSKAAQQSVTRQYGLVRGEDGSWGKPDMAFLQRQMTSQGWGPDQTAATPVGIGGARWMMGPGGPQFTGQASDAQFGNMPVGQAYDSAQQTPYGRTRRTRTFGNVGY